MTVMGTVPQPTLETERLFLRPFEKDAISLIPPLASDYEVSCLTRLPHPYTIQYANEFFERQLKEYQAGTNVNFAIWCKIGIESKDEMVFIGAINFHEIDLTNKRAEVGYWIGKQFWKKGYATEATKALFHYGFQTLNLHRIAARHLVKNPASGNVLKKLGMQYEGRFRQDTLKEGKFEDTDYWAILVSDCN